jgi:hypothetical protein
VINFVLGSFVMITLPSLIIPGSGVLLSIVRATLWGLLLGPAEASLAMGMVPHTGTLLLEGAGYILATFFALLIPISLFRSRQTEKPAMMDELQSDQPFYETERDTAWSRFRRSVRLNFKANVLIAIVLAVAACYEAVEVILMAGL